MKVFRTILAFALVLAVAACTTAKMMHPAPVAVPSGLTRSQVATAVRAALIRRGWKITGSTANSYTAVLTGSDWEARIRTPYDTHQVGIEYVSSKGLKYSEAAGTETINRHWNNWMVALVHDIRSNLSAATYGR